MLKLNHTVETGASTVTRTRLKKIAWLMESFYIDRMTWPDPNTWEEQIVSFINMGGNKATIEDEENMFLDGWKNKYRYVISKDSGKIRRFVYSFGENGRDENEGGDDIAIEVKLTQPVYDYGDNETITQKRLENLALSMRYYFSANGSWPDIQNWHKDIEKYLWEIYGEKFAYVKKYFGERAMFEGENSIFRDPWGHDIQYKTDLSVKPTRGLLYSYGRNKKDEDGKGDDIVQIVK